MAERCETCRFWGAHNPTDPKQGYCRRYAPRVSVALGIWVETWADWWCGDYAPSQPGDGERGNR